MGAGRRGLPFQRAVVFPPHLQLLGGNDVPRRTIPRAALAVHAAQAVHGSHGALCTTLDALHQCSFPGRRGGRFVLALGFGQSCAGTIDTYHKADARCCSGDAMMGVCKVELCVPKFQHGCGAAIPCLQLRR